MSRDTPQPIKPKRAYDSTRRQAQARETRRQIIEAARRMFIEHGYAGATFEVIAQEAGVAPETIFAAFGNKRKLLAHLIDVAVGGDEQPVPLLKRPGPQAALHASDPVQQLNLFSEDIAAILERVAPIFAILRVAAKTEPDIAELLKNLLEQRLRNLAAFVHSLSANGPLREGLNEILAAEIVWTLTSPEVFSLLTVDRGWSKESFVRWLSDTLIRVLLP